MKCTAIYICLAALLVASCSKAPVQDDSETFIAFEDQAFKDYCLWLFDKDGDGEISLEEAKEVKSIIVNRTSMFSPAGPSVFTSLRGIEYFCNLENLVCPSNVLTSLDVSQNKALRQLYCENNHLTSLDVSRCSTLIELICESNELTSLDVSDNPKLALLWCKENPALSEIWLKSGQTLSSLLYDENVATIKYK